ncbi:MAG: hypothetical protein IPG86_12350 [Chitinophagaceae bacterium]|nr:hypothetical protein [Chitinophagaceae bacterium]
MTKEFCIIRHSLSILPSSCKRKYSSTGSHTGARPYPDAISPTEGPKNTLVTIRGTGFGTNAT